MLNYLSTMALIRSYVFASFVVIASSKRLDFLSDEFINMINEKQSLWTAARNFPEDTPLSYLENLAGTLDDNSDKDLPIMTYESDALSNLPKEFDSRNHWKKCHTLNQVRDQGSCNSCWAVAAASAMSDRYCIISEELKNIYFSEQDILSCCKGCSINCNKGNLIKAWQYCISNGVVSGGSFGTNEGCKPYEYKPCNHTLNQKNKLYLSKCNPKDVKKPICKNQCISKYILYAKDKHYCKYYAHKFNNTLVMMSSISKYGPITSTFDLYSDFYSYSNNASNVYKYTLGHFMGKHSVKIIGWGTLRNVDYWLIANSWNKYWGENGFFKIIRGINHLKIEENAVAALMKI